MPTPYGFHSQRVLVAMYIARAEALSVEEVRRRRPPFRDINEEITQNIGSLERVAVCRLRLQGNQLGRQQAGRREAEREPFRSRPLQATGCRDTKLVLAGDVQRREAERPLRAYRHQARQGLRREFRARIDPRRPTSRTL